MPSTWNVDFRSSACPRWNWEEDKKCAKDFHLFLFGYSRHKNAKGPFGFAHFLGHCFLIDFILHIPPTGPIFPHWHSSTTTIDAKWKWPTFCAIWVREVEMSQRGIPLILIE
jgi:hypothetical protein